MIKNKRIFITGGAGFISSALIKKYLDNNKIIVYDNFVRDTLSSTNLLGHENLCIIRGDILDIDLLTSSMREIDILIHAAAIAGIDTVIKDPIKTMEVNIIGTSNVLKAAAFNKITDRVIDFSTSEVYGSMAFKASEGNDTVIGSAGEGRWTYAISKLAGEHLTQAYYRQYGLPVVTVRPFNIYGPGQTGEGAINNFIDKAIQDETISIHGNGSQIRAWCFITDFINCLSHCIEDPKAIGQSFNIGNDRAVITILGLAQTVCRVLKSNSKIQFTKPLSADIQMRVPDVQKCLEYLGFSPEVDLEEGILKTALWKKSQYQHV